MCFLSRMGGALKGAQTIDHLPVIGIDETVHDLPAAEVPPDECLPSHETSILPGPQKVFCDDDIIGVRAALVYEDCLRQLVTFLALPVDRCTGVLRTGQACDCVAPFKTNITIKGTAMRVSWVSPGSHIKLEIYGNRKHYGLCIYMATLICPLDLPQRTLPMDMELPARVEVWDAGWGLPALHQHIALRK